MDQREEAALAVLRANRIEPPEHDFDMLEMPGMGHLQPHETALPVTLEDIFGQGDVALPDDDDRESDDRLRGWIEDMRGMLSGDAAHAHQPHAFPGAWGTIEPPEPNCAWYQPMHFFGRRWGIYIREQCVLHEAMAVARHADRAAIAATGLTFAEVLQRLLRAGFYSLFLHEQFHHKVESLGFRMLVTSGMDRYRPYKFNVYRPTFGTRDCLEESLANADSYLRLSEGRYTRKLSTPFRAALKRHLKASFRGQPPGYAQAINYLQDGPFRDGCRVLQSQMLDGTPKHSTPIQHWLAAPDLIRAMMDFTAQIYVVLPAGARPVFPTGMIDPRVTISSREMAEVLVRHYGCERVKGGKGSHIKLKGPLGQTVTLTLDLTALPGHEIRQAMQKFLGDHATLRDLVEFRSGRAAPRVALVNA